MARKLQTIYEYFNEYSEEEIDYAISTLNDDEKTLIYDRYGNDLHNPITTGRWSNAKGKRFYSKLMPKIKKILESKIYFEKKDEETVEEIEDTRLVVGSSITVKLLDLIKEGKSNKEMCETLGLEPKELYSELLNLKNQGMFLNRKYSSDARIRYRTINTMADLRGFKCMNQDRILNTFNNEDSVRVLVISDLHLGNREQRLDLLDRAFNYSVKKGIHVIFCCGDMVDGVYTKGEQFISDPYTQLEYFIENYPQDKSIITFAVAGDHDISVFNQSGIDMIEILNNYRHDVIVGGYNNSSVLIKNDKVHLFHHIDGGALRKTDAPIIIHGHSHKYSSQIFGNTLNFTAPTLSNITELMPTAIDMELDFERGYISKSKLRQIYFGSEDIVLNESTYDHSKRGLPSIPIKYEEVPLKEEDTPVILSTDPIIEEGPKLSLTTKQGRLSQTDKFLKRYGNL